MKYSCRPGIVRMNVCGEYFLAPVRSVAEEVPSVMRLSLLGAAIWEEIEKEHDLTKLVEAFSLLTKRPPEEMHRLFEKTVDTMVKKGYLIERKEDA